MTIKKYAGVCRAASLFMLILLLGSGCCKMKETATDENTLNEADDEFETSAAYTDLNIIAVSDSAAMTTADTAIRLYAIQAADLHRQAYKDLENFARWHIRLPETPDTTHMNVVAKMQQYSGSAFDSAYLYTQKSVLTKAIAEYNKELVAGRFHIVTAHAVRYLPVIQRELAVADSLRQAYGY